MVFKSILAASLIACSLQLASAQTTDPSLSTTPTEQKSTTTPAVGEMPQIPEPLFVFNVDGKTVIVDPEKHKIPVSNLLDGDAINSIEILSNEEGEMRFGDKGKNGVIIVNFKEFAILPAGIAIKDGDGE